MATLNVYNQNLLLQIMKLNKKSIENYIFYKRNNLLIDNLSNLLDETTIKEVAENYQNNVLSNINKHNLGHQRLMIINEEIDSLNNGLTHSSKPNKYSIISKNNSWLQQQKEICHEKPNRTRHPAGGCSSQQRSCHDCCLGLERWHQDPWLSRLCHDPHQQGGCA